MLKTQRSKLKKLITRNSIHSIFPGNINPRILILLSCVFLIFLTSCKAALPKNYKIYIAPIINRTNWAQVDTELLEYLHSFFNKITVTEKKKELADIQIYISINNIQILTHTSGNLDTPLFSDILLSATIVLLGEKINYNLELYEEAQYIPGQNETIDYALQRLYEKITTRTYFEIIKVIRSDKKV